AFARAIANSPDSDTARRELCAQRQRVARGGWRRGRARPTSSSEGSNVWGVAADTKPDHAFPPLTPRQGARGQAHGRTRSVGHGEVLVDVGDRSVPFFVVVTGEVQVLRPADGAETLIVTHGPGHFSGEGNLLAGRRALARLRVTAPGEV